MEMNEEGVLLKVGEKVIKVVRFAVDQGMVANSNKGLQAIMNDLNETAKKYGMKINVRKTQTMIVSRKKGSIVSIEIDGLKVEQVAKFKYLGAWITDDAKCDLELRDRIAVAKEAFSKRRELLTKGLSLATKKKIIKTLIWSVALYGAETWTLKADVHVSAPEEKTGSTGDVDLEKNGKDPVDGTRHK